MILITVFITTLWSMIRLYYNSTLSRLSNHPVYRMLIRLLFHSVMLSSYCGSVLWDWTQRELSIWTFYWLSFVSPPTKILIYIGIVMKTVIWIILSSVYSNAIPFSKRSHFRKYFGYCRRKMILSTYMHSLEWTGFLKKLNQEPILMTDTIHSTGLKGLLLFGLLCASSAEAIHDRKTALTSILCRRSQCNITMVPMSSHITSMNNENGFKMAENIDLSKYPDAFTDCDSMPFFSILSDDDWDIFLKTPIIINNAPDHAIFPEEDHMLSLY